MHVCDRNSMPFCNYCNCCCRFHMFRHITICKALRWTKSCCRSICPKQISMHAFTCSPTGRRRVEASGTSNWLVASIPAKVWTISKCFRKDDVDEFVLCTLALDLRLFEFWVWNKVDHGTAVFFLSSIMMFVYSFWAIDVCRSRCTEKLRVTSELAKI